MADPVALLRLIREMPVASSHTHHLPDGWHAGLDLNRLIRATYVNWLGIPTAKPDAHPADLLDQVGANTYLVWLSRSLSELYGLGELSPHNWDALSDAVRGAHQDPDHHMRVMTDKARMKFGVLDRNQAPGWDNGRPEFFHPAYRMIQWVLGYRPGEGDKITPDPWEEVAGFSPTTLDEFLEGMDAAIVRAKSRGCVAIKNALAYNRTIAFDRLDREAAQRAFLAEKPSESDLIAFGDVVFDRVCAVAEREEMPIQVHLGLARLRGSGPMLLEPTIARHPRVTFDLFHCGYPWVDEIGGLLHNYANVVADLCWVPAISTYAAERALNEYLDVARSSDRILWGDDNCSSEEAYGSLLAWEHVVSRTLTRRVADGLCSTNQAERLAEKLMCANVERLYG